LDGHFSKLGGNLQGKIGINTALVSIYPYLKEKPAVGYGGLLATSATCAFCGDSTSSAFGACACSSLDGASS
jgi:hypothetical protein